MLPAAPVWPVLCLTCHGRKGVLKRFRQQLKRSRSGRRRTQLKGDGQVAQAERTDLCIIGAGPAGLAAAHRARARGASVILVEAVEMGGVALNWGALPAHALAESARRAHQTRTARDLGIGTDEPRINFARINAHIKQVVDEAAADVSENRLVAMGIEVIRAQAAFVDKRTLQAGERLIRARRFVLATGSRPRLPDIPGLGDIAYHTPETIFEITRRPQHLIILGGGDTGMAIAQAHVRLGCKVTLIEMLEPLRNHEPELADIVLRRLAAEGLEVHANTGIVSLGKQGEEIVVEIRRGVEETVLRGSHFLLAAGRRANIEGLDLDKAGVRFDANGPQLDAGLRTSNRRIFCAGEVAGVRSVHAARHQGGLVADLALGVSGRAHAALLPRAAHTDPAIASVGLTEPEARQRYKTDFTITRFPFSEIDGARASGETEGHVKLIVLTSGRIIGAAIAGPRAGELIAVFALAIAMHLAPKDLESLLVPHPALAEIIPAVARAHREAHGQARSGGLFSALKRLLP